ncbi:hypothetical protein QTV44_002472 [Vibrio vulnificus]|nr:hypothetical protein [Vibrio vulnificus]
MRSTHHTITNTPSALITCQYFAVTEGDTLAPVNTLFDLADFERALTKKASVYVQIDDLYSKEWDDLLPTYIAPVVGRFSHHEFANCEPNPRPLTNGVVLQLCNAEGSRVIFTAKAPTCLDLCQLLASHGVRGAVRFVFSDEGIHHTKHVCI